MRSHALLALVALIIAPGSCANAFPQRDPQREAFYSGEERANDETRIPAEHRDRHPAFCADRSVVVEGMVGNLFAAGETIDVMGTVHRNAFVAGRQVRLEGVVEGDLFFAGETAVIAGELRGDLYGFFNEVRILEGGVVGGDLYVGGETVSIKGSVGGRVVGAGRSIDVQGTVGEDLFVAFERIEIHEGASVGGDLLYDSPSTPIVRDPASIAGTIERVEHDRSEIDVDFDRHGGGSLFWDIMSIVVLFLSTLLIGVVVLLASAEGITRPAQYLADKPALGLGLGFVAFVVLPVLSIFLCFLPPAGLLFVALFGIAVFLARIVTAVCVGKWLLGKTGAGDVHAIVALIVGLVIFYAVTAIPYLGSLVWLAWVLSGLGGIVLALQKSQGGRMTERGSEAAPAI